MELKIIWSPKTKLKSDIGLKGIAILINEVQWGWPMPISQTL